MGETDEDDFLRCGIPMRSHTNPSYGCRITDCDREMVESLLNTFQCSGDQSLPKSPWCYDERYVGKAHCTEYLWTWKIGLWPVCKAAGKIATAYHSWKIKTACSIMKQQILAPLDDIDNAPPRGWRMVSSLLTLLGGTRSAQQLRGGVAWNCTCP